MAVIGLFTQTVCDVVDAAEVRVIVPFSFTLIVPLRDGLMQTDPVVVTVYANVPNTVGVPEIVNTPLL
jgi:hypothetical protein